MRIPTLVKRKTLRILIFFYFILLTACSSNKALTKEGQVSTLQPYIDSIINAYAPDKRVVLFDVEVKDNLLKGETTSPSAKAALLRSLQSANKKFIDSITVLPEAQLLQQTMAVVTVSVANLRTQPEHKAELATQAILGTPLQVWKKLRGWYLVQTPDKYLAWVDGDAIARMDTISYNKWMKKPKLIYTKPFGFAYSLPADGATVSDLVYGSIMVINGEDNNYFKIGLPDGRVAFVAKTEAQLYKEWRATRQPSTGNLTATSKLLLGIPYLWGGTSFKGVDCSGFTKTVYFMNGLVLPRDASQQVKIGEEIDTRNDWNNMRPGDLLFFGTLAENNRAERVVHVGMWIGNNEFIHSAGKVRISSMDPAAGNYDAYERKRFLRAKRISPEASLLDLRTNNMYEL